MLLADVEEHLEAFLAERPHLTAPAAEPDRGTRSSMERFVGYAAFHGVVEDALEELDADATARERAVARFGWLNPAFVFQQALCTLAGTESVTYREHRAAVLAGVTTRLEGLLEAQWSGQGLTQVDFEALLEVSSRESYGRRPAGLAYAQLALLALLGLGASWGLRRAATRRARTSGAI